VEAEIRWPSSEMNSCPARLIGSMVSKVRGKKRWVLKISEYSVSLRSAAD
jgi:hypothetical protein